MTSFTYDGKDYTLNMTRAGLRAAEDNGLTISEIQDKPFTAITGLFFASLFTQRVNPVKAASMLDALLDSGDLEFTTLFEELSEAYLEFFNSGESKGKGQK